MTRTLILCLLIAGCATVEPRLQTVEEARQHCAEAAHSPLVSLGIDPARTTIVAHGWRHDEKTYRLGEFSSRTKMVKVVNHPEPIRHEAIHRGLDMLGESFATFNGMFRDDEHGLIYYVMDRDFPGLQEGRIPARKRSDAKARWTSPEYASRLSAIETKARETKGWCGNG
jgi:hypothetical protein